MSELASPSAALILIVEDEEPIAQALAYIVHDCGYTSLIATNGKQALQILEEQSPNLILIDLMMPQMNGRELIAILRQSEVPPPPLILMSAAGKRYIADAGADDVMAKPFDIVEVEELLRRYVNKP